MFSLQATLFIFQHGSLTIWRVTTVQYVGNIFIGELYNTGIKYLCYYDKNDILKSKMFSNLKQKLFSINVWSFSFANVVFLTSFSHKPVGNQILVLSFPPLLKCINWREQTEYSVDVSAGLEREHSRKSKEETGRLQICILVFCWSRTLAVPSRKSDSIQWESSLNIRYRVQS